MSEQEIMQTPQETTINFSSRGFDSEESFINAYDALTEKLSKSLEIPTLDSDEDTISKFYEAIGKISVLPKEKTEESLRGLYSILGLPKDKSEYDLGELKETFASNPDYDDIIGSFHSAGLTNSQVNSILKFQKDLNEKHKEAYTSIREKAESSLKKTWGADYEKNLDYSKLAVKTLSDKYPEYLESLKEPSIGSEPAVAIILSEMGKVLHNSVSLVAHQVGDFQVSAQAIKDEFNKISKDKGHILMDKKHKEYPETYGRWVELKKKIYG